ncbi:hypothetical protein HRbin01_00059 [archaeon HR01]|nr:hypothetical protein HRbin01_00059 [archaeon HR01]
MRKIILAGVLASLLIYLADPHPYGRIAAYTILAALTIYLFTSLLIPLFAVASHLHSRESMRKTWSENRYALATLALQSALSFASLITYVLAPKNLILHIILFAVNTYMTARLAAECHATPDRGLALTSLLLGLATYLVYSLTLLGGLT